MRLHTPADVPRRELVEARLETAFGLDWLVLTVERQAGVSKKTGEVRYRPYTTRYLTQVVPAGVRLVTERVDEAGQPVAYYVNEYGCDCPDAQFEGRRRTCKHQEGCRQVGILKVAGGERIA